MDKRILETIKQQYPAGSRVELVQMDDVQAPQIGTLGPVVGVDDMGSLLVSWDNGSSLNVLYQIDRIKKK